MYYVGLDGHKDTAVFCVTTNSGSVKDTFTVPASPEGMDALMERMKGRKYKVLAETSTYTIDLYDYCVSKGVEFLLAHPAKLKLITESCKKTDSNDAKALADYLRLWDKGELDISISFIVTGDGRDMRDICRQREDVTQLKGRTMQKITQHMRRRSEYLEGFDDLSTKKAKLWVRETYGDDIVLMNYMDLYAHLETLGNQLDKAMEKAFADRPDVRLIRSIPGIGTTTAIEIASMIQDIGMFESADRMRSFFGMAPKVRDSGQSVKHSHITKRGDPMMRAVLSRVVMANIRFAPNDSIARYHRSHKGSMRGGTLQVATANKLLDLIYAILKRETPYMSR